MRKQSIHSLDLSGLNADLLAATLSTKKSSYIWGKKESNLGCLPSALFAIYIHACMLIVTLIWAAGQAATQRANQEIKDMHTLVNFYLFPLHAALAATRVYTVVCTPQQARRV